MSNKQQTKNIKTMWTNVITLKNLFLIENSLRSVFGAAGRCRFCVSENERRTHNSLIRFRLHFIMLTDYMDQTLPSEPFDSACVRRTCLLH